MKIIYDARHIEYPYTGLGRYSSAIIIALINNKYLYNELTILLSSTSYLSDNPHFMKINALFSDSVRVKYIDAPPFKGRHHLNVSRYVNSTDTDLYFYPHFDVPIFVKKKTVFVIHDLKTLVLKNNVMKNKLFKQKYFYYIIQNSLRKSNCHCVTISQSTHSDILKYFKNNIANDINVIYEDAFPIISTINKNEKAPDNDYLLYVGDRRPHKNIRKMIDIFKILYRDYGYTGKLIIAGQEKNFDFNVDEYISTIPGVECFGIADDQQLHQLYKKMDALFYISKYEGFGLPIIEAAYYNKKIITSNVSSIPEIAPESALLLDISQENRELAHQIKSYLESPIIIENSKYLKKFSWDETAKQIFSI